MKASYIEEHGGADIQKYGDLPDPVAGTGEVIVDIHAATVNAADAKVRAGGTYGELESFPHVLGRDFSGVISALGEGVTDFTIGDAVFGACDRGQEGTYAEKISMKAAIIAKKPDGVSHIEAACLTLTGLTAIISVEETLQLKSSETILIQGGAGGVAGFAIELAKHIGAHVITTCSTGNVDYVQRLGADRVIDYTKKDFTEVLSDVDCVFETVGGVVNAKSFEVVKSGGRVASIASGMLAPTSPRDDVISLRPAVGRDRPHLERIMALFQSGVVQAPPVKTFSLEQAPEAHRISEGRHLRGKLVFVINQG
ncbi:MAG: NADP-dependent oxidoreductase [Alphaproteobacteria bacterium]|nr:NADP-dependent oxidoreductase [Alphaproteobacteria bacterium]